MKPEQFIREFGVDEAKAVVRSSANALVDCGDGETFHVNYLKRLLESVYLVLEHYTVERAKIYADSPYTAPEVKQALEQAIRDYESIYGGSHES
ncbi:hypothetical protein A0168_RS14885 [Acinetobacter baumannii]|uniref:hypothetical protein n=1 Tax=Acinetobacter baumannii TaxID=470 RepID=UPI00026E1D64|nr:hypothetical protein [Acinetobacter baumannii]EHU1664446.1 hypothetical protein [Acinetobacter baumannii]EHU1785265.1 hypothetical protein [Acinetobacter baumannii]EHU2236033.1 hypothetical protein [Acinetobacter baumannii]EHU2344453.1 hypothetical protein [Acinetobacter baumannii]EHU2416827.1 hypothetical protein [Acinetobacter baumannii]